MTKMTTGQPISWMFYKDYVHKEIVGWIMIANKQI